MLHDEIIGCKIKPPDQQTGTQQTDSLSHRHTYKIFGA
jgi:hypothetical protein